MITLTVKIPERYLREIDKLVEEGLFTSRSEAVRYALRELIKRETAYWRPDKIFA